MLCGASLVVRPPEHKTLVQLIFQPITDGKADNSAEVSCYLGLESTIERKSKAPEYQRRDDPHAGVNDEQPCVFACIDRAESEDVFLVQHVFDDKADNGTDGHGGWKITGSAVKKQTQFLAGNIGDGRDQREKAIGERESHAWMPSARDTGRGPAVRGERAHDASCASLGWYLFIGSPPIVAA